jgi:signal transduction histidine kinase
MGFRIINELVAESGGHLKIDSTQGEGTEVCIRWFAKRWD